MSGPAADAAVRRRELERRIRERILLLDGAFGTMLQGRGLEERDYRGGRFRDHPHDLAGNFDILCLTRPDVVADVHDAYLGVGADIIETCTFSATSIAQADYGTGDLAREINCAAARIAWEVAARHETDGRPRFVAGALGPTNRTASVSPVVEDPAARNVTYDELRRAYRTAALGLIEGGADMLLVETVFDTLNGKAALHAIAEVFDRAGIRLPVMISGTITDSSGRTLTGQTPPRSGRPCATPGRSRSASTARWGRGSFARTCRRSLTSPTGRYVSIRTRGSPTPSAATTKRLRAWPPTSAISPRTDG